MSETTQIRGYLTSFAGMFGREHGDTTAITRIEIPMIQRDYAQGRRNPRATEVREAFLDALLTALSGPKPLSLDFVYGRVEGVESEGVFYPLDGQQRLTTLFLLHWYLASESGHHSSDAPWTRFTYATRPSARSFCEQLTTNALPPGIEVPSEWLSDQPWYQYGWQFDPTVAGMLVMLDAIAAGIRRRGETFNIDEAWQRLTDPVSPAISFHLLPIDDMYSDEDLYITMNSRGRPLTDFENFKAQFEQIISHVPERAQEFAQKVDGPWADLMWRLDDGDRVIDDEFLRYFTFLIEICEFKQEVVDGEDRSLVERAGEVFGEQNPQSSEHLEFLIQAFDTWSDADEVDAFFTDYFSDAQPGEEEYDPGRLRIFDQTILEGDDDAKEGMSLSSNLLRRCLQTFGDVRGRRARVFSLGHSLLLYGVLMHRTQGTKDFRTRLRVLRNLLIASDNQVRRQRMPSLLKDCDRVITDGALEAVATMDRHSREDEVRKHVFLQQHPDLQPVLFRLEDHHILQGGLKCFILDPEHFLHRAQAFERVFNDVETWALLTGALLTVGDYSLSVRPWPQVLLGTSRYANRKTWQLLFNSGSREHLSRIRTVLTDFLDRVDVNRSLGGQYRKMIDVWLDAREEHEQYDWRYYLVKYDSMRSGRTGRYAAPNQIPGYRMAMLRTVWMSGNYRDPFLLEIWQQWQSRTPETEHHRIEEPWFSGYESQPRWLNFLRSGIGIRSVAEGFEIRPPEEPPLKEVLENALADMPGADRVDNQILIRIPQRDSAAGPIDSANRIDIGGKIVTSLLARGL